MKLISTLGVLVFATAVWLSIDIFERSSDLTIFSTLTALKDLVER